MAHLRRFLVVFYLSLFWAVDAFGQSTCTLNADGTCRFEATELNTEYDANGYSIMLDSLGTEYPFTTLAIQFDGSNGTQTETHSVVAGQTGILPINDKPLRRVQFITVEISGIRNLPDGATQLSMGDGQNPIALLEQTESQDNNPPINQPPLTEADSLRLIEGATGTVYPLANDRDPEGKTLRLEAVDSHPNLTLRRIANEGVEITAINMGVHDVNYVVLDPDGGQAMGMITVGVNPKPQSDWPVQILSLSGLAENAVSDMREQVSASEPLPAVKNTESEIDAIHTDFVSLTDQLMGIDHADVPSLIEDMTELRALLPDSDTVSPWLTTLDEIQTQAQTDLQSLRDLLANPPDGQGDLNRAGDLIEKILQDQETLQAHLAAKPSDYPGVDVSQIRGELTALENKKDQILNDAGKANIWPWLLGGLFALGGLGLVLRWRAGSRIKEEPKAPKDHKNDPQNLKKIESEGDVQRTATGQIIFPLSALTANMRAEKNRSLEDEPAQAGTLFEDSPMVATRYLSELGKDKDEELKSLGLPVDHEIPDGLQNLQDEFNVLENSYLATGRIGYRQEGVPKGEDQSMGTGFLIADNLVMTNHHVHHMYGYVLAVEDTEFGIEFLGEKENPESDFYKFDGKKPIIFPEIDVVIYRLKERVKNREKIQRVGIPDKDLDGRKIAVIGYPDPGDLSRMRSETRDVILGLVEPDPVFAVKRISIGEIFRHEEDKEDPYGIIWRVPAYISLSKEMSAVCHKASTMAGNSGSPIIDIQSGELLGVHFAGVPKLDYEGRENLALAIQKILDSEPENIT